MQSKTKLEQEECETQNYFEPQGEHKINFKKEWVRDEISQATLNYDDEAIRQRRLGTRWVGIGLQLLDVKAHVDHSAPVVPLAQNKLMRKECKV